MDRPRYRPAAHLARLRASPPPPTELKPRLPSWSDMGLGADDDQLDPDWWPSSLTNESTPRRRWLRAAWPSWLSRIGRSANAAFVGGVVLAILAGFAVSERPGVRETRPPVAGDEAHLGISGQQPSAAANPATPARQSAPLDGPREVASAQPTTTPLKIVSPGPPPARAQVRLEEPVLYWLPEIVAASDSTGVPASLIAGIIQVESQGNPDAVSPAGARGLMQVMPQHLADQGVEPHLWHDPAVNVHAGAVLLKWKIQASGNQWDGVRYYFGTNKCDTFTCTEEYVNRVYQWVDYYAPLIANPYDAGVRLLPAQ